MVTFLQKLLQPLSVLCQIWEYKLFHLLKWMIGS
jgi:hypothetical protein